MVDATTEGSRAADWRLRPPSLASVVAADPHGCTVSVIPFEADKPKVGQGGGVGEPNHTN